MERMTKVDENIHTAQNLLDGIVERCYVLEEENKSLKEENRKLSEGKIIYASEKEQRHYVDILEENLELKSELSKFSEAYKKYRDYEKEELAESCYDLARENEKLKEEIGKLVMK